MTDRNDADRTTDAAADPSAEPSQDAVLQGLLREAEDQGSTPAGRIRAWELIGKHLGMFRERAGREDAAETVISFDIRL